VQAPNSDISQAAARAHTELLKRHDIQFDFPRFTPPQPPVWLIWLIRHLAFLGPYMKYLFWAILVAGVALLLFLIVKSVLRRGWFARANKPERDASVPEWRPTADKARLLLSDADALAAKGHFAEAIHLILLRSIGDIGERQPGILTPALTSREIGALPQLPPAARAAFVAIAQIVESAIFAGREVGAQEYAKCRSEYAHFALVDTWHERAA
jgi:hypothetical protein